MQAQARKEREVADKRNRDMMSAMQEALQKTQAEMALLKSSVPAVSVVLPAASAPAGPTGPTAVSVGPNAVSVSVGPTAVSVGPTAVTVEPPAVSVGPPAVTVGPPAVSTSTGPPDVLDMTSLNALLAKMTEKQGRVNYIRC